MTVCSTCNDTHRMLLAGSEVMCTRCPRPCQRCRAGGNGPYCEVTPCPCICHGATDELRSDGERVRAKHHVAQLRAMLDAVAINIDSRGYPPGVTAAQAITGAATSLAMTLAKLDAYMRAEEDKR